MIADIVIKHIGERPLHPLRQEKDKIKNEWTYIEALPDGTKRIWTERMMISGCNKQIESTEYMYNLIFCPHCDEYFNQKQFTEYKKGREDEE